MALDREQSEPEPGASLAILSADRAGESAEIEFRGRRLRLSYRDPAEREALDGRFAAIALDEQPLLLRLGRHQVAHDSAPHLRGRSGGTPVVDGQRILPALEKWGVSRAAQREPGLFTDKRVLLFPGLNHSGLFSALSQHTDHIRFADPMLWFGLPNFPGVGHHRTVEQAGAPTLDALRSRPHAELRSGSTPNGRLFRGLFDQAEVIAGDAAMILRHAPKRLDRRTVVVDTIDEAALDELRRRGVELLVTLLPPLREGDPIARDSAAVIEAALVALSVGAGVSDSEDALLDVIGDLAWEPAIRYLQPEREGVHRFAFVIHPLDVSYIHKHPSFRWTRFLPDWLVEPIAARVPPMYLSRIRGGRSETNGQRIEGYLYSLCATPRQMMRRGPRATYRQLAAVARMAERRGARILGLGAFTSVVGDAGRTVAHEAGIAVTSGNSLTVAATLEAAKQALARMGRPDLRQVRVMVVGATGSIGAVCARLMARWSGDVVLVSIEPDRLIELKQRIRRETPGCRVAIATRTRELLPDCDLVISATSAFGQRVVDISQCRAGAVICDVARPPDISDADAATRPDVLVIEGGEVLIPGEIDFGYDIGLPPKVAYACLGETALLAMDGNFSNFTIGRELQMERVEQIWEAFERHGFRIAGLRSLGQWVDDGAIEARRRLAEALRADPARMEATRREAAERLATIPVQAKGVRARRRRFVLPTSWAGPALRRLTGQPRPAAQEEEPAPSGAGALALEVLLGLPAGLIGLIVGGGLAGSTGQVVGAAAGFLVGVIAVRRIHRSR